MGSLSLMHWLIVIVVAALLFGGRGKISSLMGDFAKGIKAFKAGLKEEGAENVAAETPPQVTAVPKPGPATPAGAHAGAEARPVERG
jgi:sec-independent protein translocase protein TatA